MVGNTLALLLQCGVWNRSVGQDGLVVAQDETRTIDGNDDEIRKASALIEAKDHHQRFVAAARNRALESAVKQELTLLFLTLSRCSKLTGDLTGDKWV